MVSAESFHKGLAKELAKNDIGRKDILDFEVENDSRLSVYTTSNKKIIVNDPFLVNLAKTMSSGIPLGYDAPKDIEKMYLVARGIIEETMLKGVSMPVSAVGLVESANNISDLERLSKIISDYTPSRGFTLDIGYVEKADSQGRIQRIVDFNKVKIVPVTHEISPSPEVLSEARERMNQEINMEYSTLKLNKLRATPHILRVY